jgi:Ca-activated chloride channel family protein
MDVLRFENSEYLWGLTIVPLLLIILILLNLMAKKKLENFGDNELVEKLSIGFSSSRKTLKFISLLLALAALSFAFANPQLGSKLEKVKREGVDIMIAVDVSNSMLAEDIRPNRLKNAQMSINKLVDKLQGDRIGLIVFAGNAYTQLPITSDYAAAKMFLSTLSTTNISSQGTDISSAIELARKSFKKKDEDQADDKKNKAIIIITDGEDHEPGAISQAEEAAEDGIIVYTIGMGKERGGPIPIYRQGIRTSYKKDKDGNTIITRLNEKSLSDIAKAGKGKYIRANNSDSGLDQIFTEINGLDKVEIEAKVFKDYEDRFQWPVAIALLFLIIELMIVEMKSDWKLIKSLNTTKDSDDD